MPSAKMKPKVLPVLYLYYDVKIRFHSCFVAYFLEMNC